MNIRTDNAPPAVPSGEQHGTVMEAAANHRIDVGIITIKEEEFAAVLDHFAPSGGFFRRGKRRDYETAVVDTPSGPCNVAITRCLNQGTGQAQVAATDMLDDLNAAYIIVVGIAGGIPTQDFTLGDVIVSTFIHDLTLEDTGTDTPRFSATGGPLHAEASRVVARLQALSLGPWEDSVKATRPPYDGSHSTPNKAWNKDIDDAFAFHRVGGRSTPIARGGHLGSSDRLVKDPVLVAAWRSVLKGIVAVEMEVAGVYTVCQPRNTPCFAIRGISDIVGYVRDERWTIYSCDTAAAFARALVGTGVLRGEYQSQTHLVPGNDLGVGVMHAESTLPFGTNSKLLAILEDAPKLRTAAHEVISSTNYPRIMSVGDRLVPNPVWNYRNMPITTHIRPISDRLRGHMFLVVAQPAGMKPHLYCYRSERWGAYLLPFFKHVDGSDGATPPSLAVDEHVARHFHSRVIPTGKFMVSVKINEEHPDEWWLYAFEFYSLVLPENFEISERHRWLDLERLSDPKHREAIVNGDLVRAIRSHFGTGLHGLERSPVTLNGARFGSP